MELIRQPIYLLMMSFSAVFIVFLSCVPYFGFGDDPKMVKDSVLAIMLLTGLFGAVVGAAASAVSTTWAVSTSATAASARSAASRTGV